GYLPLAGGSGGFVPYRGGPGGGLGAMPGMAPRAVRTPTGRSAMLGGMRSEVAPGPRTLTPVGAGGMMGMGGRLLPRPMGRGVGAEEGGDGPGGAGAVTGPGSPGAW